RFLGDVLRQERVAELAPDQSVDRPHVPPVQLLERPDLAVAISTNEIDVAGLPLVPGDRLFVYLSHGCARQATTVARVRIPSGSFRASRRSIPVSVSASTAVTPDEYNASQPGPLLPAISSTGTPAAWARRATSAGALPKALCPSTRPSPVITRFAPP